jgi:hypothetical protein
LGTYRWSVAQAAYQRVAPRTPPGLRAGVVTDQPGSLKRQD